MNRSESSITFAEEGKFKCPYDGTVTFWRRPRPLIRAPQPPLPPLTLRGIFRPRAIFTFRFISAPTNGHADEGAERVARPVRLENRFRFSQSLSAQTQTEKEQEKKMEQISRDDRCLSTRSFLQFASCGHGRLKCEHWHFQSCLAGSQFRSSSRSKDNSYLKQLFCIHSYGVMFWKESGNRMWKLQLVQQGTDSTCEREFGLFLFAVRRSHLNK